MSVARFSRRYLEALLDDASFEALATLRGALLGHADVDLDAPDYGLPACGFILVETLAWVAQSERSGTWTYFEATPPARQSALAAALHSHAPAALAEGYRAGQHDWHEAGQHAVLDRWMDAQRDALHAWLAGWLQGQRPILMPWLS